MEKTRIQKYYSSIVVEDLLILYNCQNIMQIPHLDQAVLSTSSKNFLLDKQEILNAFAACLLLTGQRGAATRARKSIAAFQLRKDSMLGCMVTIRRSKMFALLDKILTFVLPRLHNIQNAIRQSKMSSTKTFTDRRLRSTFLALPSRPEPRSGLREKILSSWEEADRAPFPPAGGVPRAQLGPTNQILPDPTAEEAQLYLASSTQSFRSNLRKHLQLGVKEPILFPEIESMFEGLSVIKGLNVIFSLSTHRFKKPGRRESDQIEYRYQVELNRYIAREPIDLIFFSAFQYPNVWTKSVL